MECFMSISQTEAPDEDQSEKTEETNDSDSDDSIEIPTKQSHNWSRTQEDFPDDSGKELQFIRSMIFQLDN